MGIALLVPDLSFSSSNIGQITMVDDLESLSINVASGTAITAMTYQFSVSYSPLTTAAAQRGVSWSVISGGEYASIDSSGLMTISPTASSNNVTIRATSVYDASIYADVTVIVTFTATTAIFTDERMFNFNTGKYVSSTVTGGWHTTDGIDVEGYTTFNYKTIGTTGDNYGNYSSVLFFNTENVNTNASGYGDIKQTNGTFEVSIPTGAVRAVLMNHGTDEGVTYWLRDN